MHCSRQPTILDCSSRLGNATVRGRRVLASIDTEPRLYHQLSDSASHLQIATKCVGDFNLARRPALHLEQRRAGDNYSSALSTGNRNVQAVQTVQEFHSPWGVLRG